MNAQLQYIIAQQRIAELHRSAERARLASVAGPVPRHSRESSAIARLSARLARLTTRSAPTGL
jgi:hypothetical protein